MPHNDNVKPKSHADARCPKCGTPMLLLAVVPTVDDGADEITSRGEICKALIVRVRPRGLITFAQP
jgi:hypothetical protein